VVPVLKPASMPPIVARALIGGLLARMLEAIAGSARPLECDEFGRGGRSLPT
jgi:hypothetical protein